MDLKSRIQELASTLHPEVVGLRRHLHAHPELSFEEAQTAAYVEAQLAGLGLDIQTGVGGHGLVALLHGQAPGPGRVIALRADMDALPIHEANEVPYRSRHTGVMHACGHDAHTASLLGTARILSRLRDQFAGTVKFLFQPAEERLPGGASLMIRDGALDAPRVEAILGQHVQPYLDSGKIGIRSGMYMASADEIYLRVIGKGGHAAHPAHFIDPVMITAQMLVSLQQVISRSDPRIPAILSFGKLQAQGATNIIPDEVYVEGTLRCLDETKRHAALAQVRRIVEQVASMYGGRAELDIRLGYPVLHNDEALAQRNRAQIAAYVGEENVVDLDIWMAAEDFAWYTQEVPGCFYRLGTRNEARGITHGLHTPQFDIDEDALRLSTGLMAWLTLQELQVSA